jgi:hypothetical protein
MNNLIEALKDFTGEEIEAFIAENFERNYARLQMEGGHALTPYVKAGALRQVQMYWRKMREVAVNVTDTEVKLTLPDQATPRGRNYTIEGVVDIVREDGRTVMYDIKTHDPDMVRGDLEPYEKQLNVYAHIWQGLRGNELDETAIIATAFPATLREAIGRKDKRREEEEIEKWNPLIGIPLDPAKVEGTIRDFGATVDAIEDKRFAPPSVESLKKPVEGTRDRFATRTCRNCDARFSCSSYRNYAISTGSRKDFNFSEYFTDTDASGLERIERVTVTLDQQPAQGEGRE